jgi:phage regulator Rha-like protein
MQLKSIQKRIYTIRDQKVMLDYDLAELYEVETRVLNQAVKRNKDRFPKRFMFQLTKEEWRVLISQFVISKSEGRGGTQKPPFAFTEHGVAMLASVLRSKKAIKINISIIEAFIALREFALTYKELAEEIKKLELKSNKQFADVYEVLKYLMDDKQNRDDWKKRKQIGYKKE